MKNRLQALWDELTPDGGPCPQPDVKRVRRRVDAALDGKRRAFYPRRALRPALAAVLALLLLTGTALAGGDLIPPEFNVLTGGSFRGNHAANAIAMMTITPVSVSDDNYTMTVTSSLADKKEVYFTLLIEAHNDAAWEELLDVSGSAVSDLLSFRISGSYSYGHSGEVDPDHERTLRYNVSAAWMPMQSASVRLELMKEGLWLEFPVKTIRSVTLGLDADGQGMGDHSHAAGGPVHLKTVEVSPLSFSVDYTTPKLNQGVPVLYFLYKDGTIKTQGQLGSIHPSGHGGPEGIFGSGETYRNQYSYQFPSVQDLSQMEAVIFEGTAYPMAGGEPYPVDMSGFVRPFTIPVGEYLEESPDFSVPLFALCDGLGADCRWDEGTGTATATYRGVTMTFTLGSRTVQVDGMGWDETETTAAPVYRDGELWVDAVSDIRGCWDLGLIAAFENSWANGFAPDETWTDWVVIP